MKPETTTIPINQMLALYRAQNGYTVRELAKRLGIDYSALSRIEHGRRVDAETQIKLIAWVFGLTK
jgi:transcriptional regulator with XRE-family HTH domain